MMKRTPLFLLAATLLLGNSAAAQDNSGDADLDALLESATGGTSTAESEQAAGPDGTAKPAASANSAVDHKALTGRDESIYIVQRRAYSKTGGFEITPLVFTALNPKFVGYAGGGVAASYHFEENLAIEFMSSLYNRAFYSDLVVEVYHYRTLTPEVVDLKQMSYFNALSLQFSALYGKLELYGYLVDYDFYANAGVGFASTLEPCWPKLDDCPNEPEGASADNPGGDNGLALRPPSNSVDRFKITANLGGGMRVFFHDMFGLRLEVRDITYADHAIESTQEGSAGLPSTDIRNIVMLFVGMSILL